MALSKPIYAFAGLYLEQLFSHPVRTKSVTSSILAASANYTSQKIAGKKEINGESVFAYGLYGLIFGGSVPHYFYRFIERAFRDEMKFRKFWQFLTERLLYTPFAQALSLYFLSIFEWNSHDAAVANLKKLYWPVLEANWQYLSIPVFLNFYFVPPMFRTILMSLVSFIWVVYIADKRRRAQEKRPSGHTED